MDRISTLEKEIAEIRKTLYEKEKQLYKLKKEWLPSQPREIQVSNEQYHIGKLQKWAIERYSRQILLPEIGTVGQEKLCSGRVLIVGAGGLGCPAAAYLAGAGVGEIGIVDYDTVELTNIHRQILHGESDQNLNKVDSAVQALKEINSKITVTPYNVQLDSSNALEIACNYDVVLDCTDNVPTRYMLNDVCVLRKIPLISGSALKMEGQITIYGYRAASNPNEKDSSFIGPCYRCVFPSPPPAAAVGSCSANGVAGPVPGVIGALQALEAIKYLVGQTNEKLLVNRMILFDGEDATFRTVKLRPRDPSCAACSEHPTITQLINYEQFCQAQAKEKKRLEARLKNLQRHEEKERRMTGRSYFGFRKAEPENEQNTKWIQDVPKSERKIGPTCSSAYCINKKDRHCAKFEEDVRQKIFTNFWRSDWTAKKKCVKSLVDNVPPKRRRVTKTVSRKGESKIYHLFLEGERLPVCRVMFLNTLGIKEAMVRTWMVDKPRKPKTPVKALKVGSYINSLPKRPPKCQYCRENTDIQYLNMDNIKNFYQLYKKYVEDMKSESIVPASRKTFVNVLASKNIKIFKAANENDICDIDDAHNNVNIRLPAIECDAVEIDHMDIQIDKELANVDIVSSNLYYQNVLW